MLTIVIQAGGESSRMGENKALLPFLGQPLIARVLERIGKLGDEILITTNHSEELNFLHRPLIADKFPGRGALGGLYTALFAAKYSIVAVVACDMPFASSKLFAYQVELLTSEHADVVIPKTNDGYEPFHAVYRKETCLPAVEEALRNEQRRMIAWLSKVNVRLMSDCEIAAHDPSGRAFLNVNTHEELLQAELLAQKASD